MFWKIRPMSLTEIIIFLAPSTYIYAYVGWVGGYTFSQPPSLRPSFSLFRHRPPTAAICSIQERKEKKKEKQNRAPKQTRKVFKKSTNPSFYFPHVGLPAPRKHSKTIAGPSLSLVFEFDPWTGPRPALGG